MNTRSFIVVAFAVLAGGACSTTTPIGALDVAAGASGTSTLGAAGTTGAAGMALVGAPAPIPPGHAACFPSGLQDLDQQPFTNPAGVSADWVGYFENLQFGSGSSAVAFHLGVDAAGHGTVSVTPGVGVVPPPPTDPFDEWPPRDVATEGNVDIPRPVEGFAYTAHEVTWQGNRLKFSVLHAEPWAAWCALQTSYPPVNGISGEYSCNASYDVESKTRTVSFCEYTDKPEARCTPDHELMCWPKKMGYCACSDTGCCIDNMYRTFYDVTFSADHADGSAVDHNAGGVGPPHNVRLKPAAP